MPDEKLTDQDPYFGFGIVCTGLPPRAERLERLVLFKEWMGEKMSALVDDDGSGLVPVFGRQPIFRLGKGFRELLAGLGPDDEESERIREFLSKKLSDAGKDLRIRVKDYDLGISICYRTPKGWKIVHYYPLVSAGEAWRLGSWIDEFLKSPEYRDADLGLDLQESDVRALRRLPVHVFVEYPAPEELES